VDWQAVGLSILLGQQVRDTAACNRCDSAVVSQLVAFRPDEFPFTRWPVLFTGGMTGHEPVIRDQPIHFFVRQPFPSPYGPRRDAAGTCCRAAGRSSGILRGQAAP
jgi:hypothetical protein